MSWCNAQGWGVSKVVKECGSAINDQRPKFLALLANREMSKIVVEHKDRASRFGVASIQTLLAMQDRELVIVNTADTEESDLMGDFVAIVTSFCARLYGRRRAKRKTEQVLAALQQNGPSGESEARENHSRGQQETQAEETDADTRSHAYSSHRGASRQAGCVRSTHRGVYRPLPTICHPVLYDRDFPRQVCRPRF